MVVSVLFIIIYIEMALQVAAKYGMLKSILQTFSIRCRKYFTLVPFFTETLIRFKALHTFHDCTKHVMVKFTDTFFLYAEDTYTKCINAGLHLNYGYTVEFLMVQL